MHCTSIKILDTLSIREVFPTNIHTKGRGVAEKKYNITTMQLKTYKVTTVASPCTPLHDRILHTPLPLPQATAIQSLVMVILMNISVFLSHMKIFT